MPNTFDIGSFGTAAATEAASGILGMALGAYNDNRQRVQQGKLQKLQIQGQKEMTDYNMMKQYEMWLKTGYGGQMEQLKKAGLNPGLIYGMGGAGGATTGEASGNVTGAHAPAGGGEIQSFMGMGIQAQLLQAQKELIQAQTEKTKGEAANLPATAENIKADTALKNIHTDIAQIEQYIKGKTQNMAISIIQSEMKEAYEQANIKANEGKVSKATIDTEIKTIEAKLANILADTTLKNAQRELTKQGITVNNAQMEKWKAEIANLITIADQRDQEIQINKFKAEVDANNPGIWQVMGGFIKQASGKLGELFGDTNNEQTVPTPKPRNKN